MRHERLGQVSVIRLGDGENRFSPAWLDDVERALDEVEKLDGAGGLVTVGEGKFFSNGLDVDWMVDNPRQAEPYLARVQRLLARVLTFDGPTVAAVSGHAFGAGAMLALAHDWRFMREDRGYLCLPEVDLGLPFAPGLLALLQCKLTPAQATEALLTGRRFPGPAAREVGLVTGVAPQEELLEVALEHAGALTGKPAGAVSGIKRDLYAAAVAALTSLAPEVGTSA